MLELAAAVIAGAFGAGGAWFAVRFELRQLRRDVSRNEDTLGQHAALILKHERELGRLEKTAA